MSDLETMEIWKPVVGYEGLYEVSNLGRVKSLDRVINHKRLKKQTIKGREMKSACVGRTNHRFVSLSKDGKAKAQLIHRLVLISFVGNCPEGMECSHLDGNAENNRLDNLIWETPKENQKRRKDHGTYLWGENAPISKLKSSEVQEIKEMLNDKSITQRTIAKKYKISEHTISKIKHREVWGNLK